MRARTIAALLALILGALIAPAIASAAMLPAPAPASTPTSFARATASTPTTAEPKNRVRAFFAGSGARVDADRAASSAQARENRHELRRIASGPPLAAEGGGGAASRLIIDSATATDEELSAASQVAKMDRGPVVIRDPIAGRRTSDLLVNGVPYDIYSPTTGNANRIISAIASKNGQAAGIVLDLSRSGVDVTALGDVLARVRGAGATNIQDVIILGR